jgi:hypothetical protein
MKRQMKKDLMRRRTAWQVADNITLEISTDRLTCHSLCLSEGLEQFDPGFIRDSDAGVLNGNSKDLVA